MKKSILGLAIFSIMAIVLTACSNPKTALDKAVNEQIHQVQEVEDELILEEAKTVRFAKTAISKKQTLTPASVIVADMNYRTDTIEGIASVSDTIVLGRFINVQSSVEDAGGFKSVLTRGVLVPTEVFSGEKEAQYKVVMSGGTVSYSEIAKLYTKAELDKYQIDPNTKEHESFTQTFENMSIFEEGVDYLVTLSKGENGEYILSPSLYSLCELSETKEVTKLGTDNLPTFVSFNVEDYVTAFKLARSKVK